MEIYSLNYDYFKSMLDTIMLQLNINIESISLMFSTLVILTALLVLSRKVKKLEKTQFNDIDDITSFNRLIDDELGMLKKEHHELNEVIKSSEYKEVVQQEPTNDNKLFNNAPYTQAVQLARRGYAREDIISLCSLTESEAELILALHSDTKAA